MNIGQIFTNLNKLGNQMNLNIREIEKSNERLSKGNVLTSDNPSDTLKINRLEAEIRGSQVAEKNIQDGISFVQQGENTLSTIEELGFSLKELAVQSGSELVSSNDKKAMEEQAKEILNEMNYMMKNTLFNGKSVFQNEKVTIQTGANASQNVSIEIPKISESLSVGSVISDVFSNISKQSSGNKTNDVHNFLDDLFNKDSGKEIKDGLGSILEGIFGKWNNKGDSTNSTKPNTSETTPTTPTTSTVPTTTETTPVTPSQPNNPAPTPTPIEPNPTKPVEPSTETVQPETMPKPVPTPTHNVEENTPTTPPTSEKTPIEEGEKTSETSNESTNQKNGNISIGDIENSVVIIGDKNVGSISNQLENLVENVSGKVEDMLNNVTEELTDSLETIKDEIKNSVQDLTNVVKDAIQNKEESVKETPSTSTPLNPSNVAVNDLLNKDFVEEHILKPIANARKSFGLTQSLLEKRLEWESNKGILNRQQFDRLKSVNVAHEMMNRVKKQMLLDVNQYLIHQELDQRRSMILRLLQ